MLCAIMLTAETSRLALPLYLCLYAKVTLLGSWAFCFGVPEFCVTQRNAETCISLYFSELLVCSWSASL